MGILFGLRVHKLCFLFHNFRVAQRMKQNSPETLNDILSYWIEWHNICVLEILWVFGKKPGWRCTARSTYLCRSNCRRPVRHQSMVSQTRIRFPNQMCYELRNWSCFSASWICYKVNETYQISEMSCTNW